MIGLPKTTEFNKRIPKHKFYENIDITPELKKIFMNDIKAIYWKNKIAKSTINLAPGDFVTEIEVFEMKLNRPRLNESVLRNIDKKIHYHILFILEYEDKFQAWISYKEKTKSGNFEFKVGTYYHTEWMNEEELPLRVDGFNLDKVYENFVRQIAGNVLKSDNNEKLRESIDRANKRNELQKRINKLQQKIRKEKQFNKQVELNSEIKKLKKSLEELLSGENENGVSKSC